MARKVIVSADIKPVSYQKINEIISEVLKKHGADVDPMFVQTARDFGR